PLNMNLANARVPCSMYLRAGWCGVPRLVLLAFVLQLTLARGIAHSVTLAWDPNQEPDIAGYNLYYGEVSRIFRTKIDVGNVTSATVPNLAEGMTYFFFVTAYNTSGLESDPSNEVIYKVNSPPLAKPQLITTVAEVS